MYPMDFSLRRQHPELTRELAACTRTGRPFFKYSVAIFRMDCLTPAVAQACCESQPRYFLPVHVGVDTAPFGVCLEDANRRSGPERAEALLIRSDLHHSCAESLVGFCELLIGAFGLLFTKRQIVNQIEVFQA